MKSKLPNPWPTPQSRFEVLRGWIRPITTAQLLWNTLGPNSRRRLGIGIEEAYQGHTGTAGMWMALTGASYERAVFEVARRVNLIDEPEYRHLLEEFGEEEVIADSTIQTVVAEYALVLVEPRRDVYWRGEKIAFNWGKSPACWDCFEHLVRFAKTSRWLTRDQFSESSDLSYLSKAISKIKFRCRFPTELRNLIKRRFPAEYRLDLAPSDIRTIRVEVREFVIH